MKASRLASSAFGAAASLAPGLLALSLLVSAGCGDDVSVPGDGVVDETPPDVTGLFAVPADIAELQGETFFDHPFPSDLRRDANGKVITHGWPTGRASLLQLYADSIDRKLDGFSPVAAGFLRFSGPIEGIPTSLAASLDPAATVQLIDIDPASPTYGERQPILLSFRAEAAVYVLANTLSFFPAPGFPLHPHRKYALVATTGLTAMGGGTVGASPELAAALTDPEAPGSQVVQPAVEALEAAGIAVDTIAHLAVFTTNDPTEELAATAAALPSQIEAPTAADDAWVVLDDSNDNFIEVGGLYGPSPNYQAGTIPYALYGDGGAFVIGADGAATVQNHFDLRFSITLPRPDGCPVPPNGYPIVLYAHGTGGDYRSYRFDGTGGALAKKCVATMGVDQIFHGDRPGAPDNEATLELLFFNFQNPDAARTNIRQSALDEVQRARIIGEGHLEVPAAITGGAAVGFDPSKVYFFGHSQGSLNGPPFMAVSDLAKGAVFSGASSYITITLLEKTEPTPSVAGLVTGLFLGLKGEETAEVDLFHPALALAQLIEDPVDSIHYARLLAREPLGDPKNLLVTEGIGPDGKGDSYAPPRGCEALAMGMGLPIQEPVVLFPKDAANGGLDRVTIPAGGLGGNLANGAAAGVLAQWVPPPDSDGHFVVFDVPAAQEQAAQFLRNLADGSATPIPPP